MTTDTKFETKYNKDLYPYYWSKTCSENNGTIFHIHGFADNAAMFLANFKSTHNYNIIAVELPGHAQTPIKDFSKLTINDLGDSCIELIKQLHLKDIILSGHSMGGAIAIYVASKIPELIESLILAGPLNTHAFTLSNLSGLRFTPKNKDDINKYFKFYINEDKVNGFVRLYGAMVLENYASHAECYKTLKHNLATLSALKQMKIAERNITCPTLLVLGKQDRAISYQKTSKYFSRHIPSLTIKGLDQTGHFIYFEQPKLFNQAVDEFISKK